MKLNSFWIIFFLLTFLSFQKPTPVHLPPQLAQVFGTLLDSLEKFKHPTFEQALERANFLINQSSDQKDWETHFKTLNFKVILAEYHEKIDSIEPFIKIFEQRLMNIDPKEFTKYSFYKSRIKHRLSELYSILHQPDGCIRINKEILEGIQNKTLVFEDNLKTKTTAYYDLGYWTSEIGLITEGIDYLLLSKLNSEADPTRELDLAIIIYSQLAKRCLSHGKYTESFEYNKLALQTAKLLYKEEGISQQNASFFTSNYHSMGKYYIQISKPDSALFYLEKAAPIAKTHHKIENLIMRAKCFIQLKNLDKAETTLTAALDSIGNKFESFIVQKPQILLQLAKIKYQKSQPTAALSYCQKALTALDPTLDTTQVENNPSVKNVILKKELLETLQFKSKILSDLVQQSNNYLDPCYKTALLTARLVDSIRSDYTADFDKHYLAQTSYPIYETALNIAFTLFEKEHKDVYLTDMLNIMESSKATILLNNLQKGQAEAGFTETDRVKLFDFRQKLTKLDKQIFDLSLKNTPLSDTTWQRLQTQRATLNRDYDNLIADFKKQYPSYAAIKFGNPPLSIADIRRNLPENGVFVEYFVGENAIYTLSIDDKNAQVFKTNNPQRLSQLVENIRQSIRPKSRDDDRSDIQSYCASASELYDWLFRDPLSISSKKKSHIVFSPDGALHFIPIDILLTEKVAANPNYRTLPYLLQQARVQYVPSATVWQEQKNLPRNRVKELFVGFAPQYNYTKPIVQADTVHYKDMLAMAEKSGELVDMPNARHEVEQIGKLLKSTHTFIGETATEDNFVKNAPNYRIVHLSMHAEYNPVNPAFSQFIFSQNDTVSSHNRLFLNELQNQKLNADLVVLSACETGYGTLSRGEGVMSLARTFTSIGVPSSVVSLWKIPSGSTENVLTQFYTYLTQSKSVSTSLRQAKLDYLQNQALCSPYYWAGLIPIGDTESSPISSSNGYWLVYLTLIFVVGIFGFWIKKKRKY